MEEKSMKIESYNQEKTNALELFNIQQAFDNEKTLQSLTFNLEEGEILCLLGPSGCGKTTALKSIAGLVTPQQGQIDLFGQTIFSDNTTNLPAEQRSIGFIFQDYALFPHMTVEQNIAYGLVGLKKQEKKQRIQQSLKLVELLDLQYRYPLSLIHI